MQWCEQKHKSLKSKTIYLESWLHMKMHLEKQCTKMPFAGTTKGTITFKVVFSTFTPTSSNIPWKKKCSCHKHDYKCNKKKCVTSKYVQLCITKILHSARLLNLLYVYRCTCFRHMQTYLFINKSVFWIQVTSILHCVSCKLF